MVCELRQGFGAGNAHPDWNPRALEKSGTHMPPKST
jgi:hypothetical protein